MKTAIVIFALSLSACASSGPDIRACMVSFNGECLQHNTNVETLRIVSFCAVR